MSDNYLKTPLAQSLNNLAEKKAHKALQATGRALPCSVTEVVSSGIVRVKFEVDAAPFTLPEVVVAKAGSEYVRIPTQVGDRGVVFSADARLGGVTGLGAGIASLTQPGNLAALVFFPLGNTDWSNEDPNAVVIYAPTGVIIKNLAENAVVLVQPGGISLTFGSQSISVTGSGISIDGVLTINGAPYAAHKHSGVTTGGGQTGGVV